MFRINIRHALLAAATAIAAMTMAASAPAAVPVTGWQQTGVRSFEGVDAFSKSQGIASDGERLFFSWSAGLHSMDLGMDTILADNIFQGIPYELKAKGLSHIGDIDYYDGQIYAPIEGKPDYNHSTIVTYDPDSLQPTGPRYELDRTYLPDGVPWIAIDAGRQVAYTSKWNNTGLLNVHRLSDFAVTSTVQLSRPVPRIQGAKVYRGMLYAARDNGPEKSIEAIDPDSGTVTNLFDRNLGDQDEAEGIAFVTNRDGTTMLTADIDQTDHGRVDVHSYRVGGDVTPPEITGISVARRRLRPGRKLVVEITSSEAASTTARWWRCTGGRKHPCGRLKRAGRPAAMPLMAGKNRFRLAPRGVGWAAGKRFHRGRFRLAVTPTDQADAVGPTRSVTFAVLKRKRKVRSGMRSLP